MSEMNMNYMKKGLVPKYMGKFTEAQWKEFAEMLKRNIYPHHMGSSRYVGKILKWKKKIEEAVSAGNPNLVDENEERIVNWLLVQSELTQDSKLV
jgi:hypothetical protein